MNRPMRPPEALKLWNELVLAKSQEFQLDAYVVAAQIWKECEQDIGNPTLTRDEPRYQYFWHPVKGALFDRRLTIAQNRERARRLLGEEEFLDQSRSYGLMQVMLATARELGLEGPPQQLCTPEIGIHYGCLYHQRCLRQARGDQRLALRYYNGAFVYADEVLRRAAILRSL